MPNVRPVVIWGALGLVGTALRRVLADRAPLSLDLPECDLTNADQVLKVMDRLRPRTVINCAAMTHVDGCESHPEEAYRLNAQGPGHLAQACRELDCLLVHLSTDFVFDGQLGRPYREDDKPNPLSVYGRTKLEGEEAVKAAGDDWLIVRTAWVYGHPRRGTIWRFQDFAKQGGPLRVVDDQVGCPTYAEDLAEGIASLIVARVKGMVHITNSGQASWWEVARKTLDLSGYQNVEINRIKAEDLGLPATRPAYAPLDTTKFQELTGRKPRPWDEALAAALQAEKEK